MTALVDTGVLYALADRDDEWHARARQWTTGLRAVLLVPVSVVPEAAYLIRTRLGSAAERAFVASLAAEELAIEPLRTADLARISELMEAYAQIGFVDASVVATAERLRVSTIATTDRRHFGAVRPRHVPAFTLVP
jgi:hypothetical protein